MKRNYAAFLVIVLFGLIVLANCSKNGAKRPDETADYSMVPVIPVTNFNFSKESNEGLQNTDPSGKLPAGQRIIAPLGLRTGGCGSTLTGSWSSGGYHQYVRDTLRFDTLSSDSAKIKIALSALVVPNRFTVYTPAGLVVAASPWMGTANYTGPWGQSINTSSSGTLNFLRGTQPYYLFLVETSVNGTTDTYSATLSCTK
ncbi:MAG: hypothetical protein KGO82_16220 [Bacteroidota bacterium]|nr:hypothetical protein [Bacteroidota bacterium]